MTARTTARALGAPGRPGRRRRLAAAVAVVGTMLALAGCVAIPTSGPVGEGPGVVEEPADVVPLADGPRPGAGPEEIVLGFLRAGAAAGLGDDFAVAREYLAASARDWDPTERVVVYSSAGSPEVTSISPTQVKVTVPVAATLDAGGRYAEAAPGASETALLDLVEDSSGQWRISGLENGILLSEPNFESLYRLTPLYFLSPDERYLVPEPRWFPDRNVATSAVRELLAGPSPWLRDAVRTAVPEGVRLSVDAVTINDDGAAVVDLTQAVLSAGTEQRSLLLAQLQATLRLPRIRDVQIQAGGVPLAQVPVAELERGVDLRTRLAVTTPDALLELADLKLVPVGGIGPLTGLGVRHPARSEDGDLTVGISGTDELITLPDADGETTVLATGGSLLAPSVDRLDWVWTGSAAEPDALLAVQADGTSVRIDADWLDGRTVRSVRVARDGARIAVLSSGADGVALDVTGVVRDDSGTPQQLGEPLRAGAVLVDGTAVTWVDDLNLAVLGRSGTMTSPALHLVPIAGQTRALPAVEDAVSIAAGKGDRALYVGAADGTLYGLSGQSWVVAATEVRDPAFPG